MDSETFYYFAIGSMMNPISWRNKRISPPIHSWAAELLDYELKFSGEMGFAEAVPAKGNSFHGVLHLVDATTMERLDELEIVAVPIHDSVIVQKRYEADLVHVMQDSICEMFPNLSSDKYRLIG